MTVVRKKWQYDFKSAKEVSLYAIPAHPTSNTVITAVYTMVKKVW